jgi:uncharacterized membrane protein
MTGALSHLAWALALFVGSHFVLSAGPVRAQAVAVLGEWPFRGMYSAVSIASFVWVIMAYAAAPAVEVWQPHTALRHLPVGLMPIAFVLVVGGYTVPNPSALVVVGRTDGTPGIIKVTRHPVMWGVGLWGLLHLAANGDAATMMLAGAMAALAVGGAWHIERRRAGDAAWQELKSESSFVPFAAVATGKARVTPGDVGWWRIALGLAAYGTFLWAHPALFGVSPLPLPGS